MSPFRRLILSSAAASLLLAGCAANETAVAPAAPQTPAFQAQLLEDVRILASDEMQGRDTGSAGGEAARDYIVGRLEALGVQAPLMGRLQPWEMTGRTREGSKVWNGVNVLGQIPGTRASHRYIVITAHYDHVGVDENLTGDKIFNGANDDGSGTVAVIEMAEAFAQAKKEGKGPRRSVLFMTVTGEEKGLLGSEYYSENPVFPLANTVANINIDMIGRMDFTYEKTKDSNYIYVIGSDKLSSELHQINEAVNEKYTQLKLDYTYNDENDPNRFYYRSDHYNFAKHRIPIIFFFNGVHADYHKPSDEVDKIIFESAEKVTRLAFHTAWELANREARIKVDSNKK
jgi:hypothetical protein